MSEIDTYPADWPAIAKAVKDAAGWQCIRCGHAHEPAAGYTLTVHHLTGEKRNCAWWNLTALCQRCHLHIQGKVKMERAWMFEHSDWFVPYVAGYYASLHGLPTDRRWVECHAGELILLGQGRIALAQMPNYATEPPPPLTGRDLYEVQP